LPFGFYKDHNNAYRFGQIVGIIVLKITAVLIADALLIYLLIKYWNMMIYSIFSVIGLIVSAYASFRIMVKLLLDFKDYLEINTDYIEWYDVQAEAIDENYFFRKPLKKGFKIHLKLTEIVAVIPIIKERERDDKGKKIDVKEFIKFKFNLITGSSTELNLAAISQIPNSDAVYDALHSVLGNKLKAIKEAGEEKE
jgi:hypothetical protein